MTLNELLTLISEPSSLIAAFGITSVTLLGFISLAKRLFKAFSFVGGLISFLSFVWVLFNFTKPGGWMRLISTITLVTLFVFN